MKLKLIWMCGLLAVALATLSGPAISQGDDGGGDMDPAEMQKKMMKKMMDQWFDTLKPNDHHKRLAKMIGTWDTERSIYMMPGKPPMKSKGSAVMTWAVKDKVVMQKYTGSFMGEVEEGVGLHGYDNYKKKHWSVWTSTFTMGVLASEGVTVDPTHKINVLYGSMDEPPTGEHDKPVKYVTRFIDDDHVKFEIWDLGMGENGRAVMKIDYTRRKADK